MRRSERSRSGTLKIRPWSKLPGVLAYVVIDGEGQLTDAWGDPSPGRLALASSFRSRSIAGTHPGSHAIEAADPGVRLVSVARRDGWFVHVWVHDDADVVGILSVVSD